MIYIDTIVSTKSYRTRNAGPCQGKSGGRRKKGEQTAPVSAYFFAKGALGGTFTLLLGIFTALFATEDQAGGTMKNLLAKGCRRSRIYLSKYLLSLAAALLLGVVTAAAAFAFGSFVWGDSLPVNEPAPLTVLGLLLGITAYHAIFFAVSYTVGKPGGAISMCVVGPMLVSLVLGMGDALIRREDFHLSDYWVEALYKALTDGASEPARIGSGIALFALYAAAATALGAALSRKKEL